MKNLLAKIKEAFKTSPWLKWVAIGVAVLIVLTAILVPTLSNSNNNATSSSYESATESSASIELSAYKITVLNADGTPAKDVKVQLCVVDESGKLGACLMPVAVNADSKVDYTADKNTYEIHVLDASMKPLELKEHVVTEAAYGEYTVTLAN